MCLVLVVFCRCLPTQGDDSEEDVEEEDGEDDVSAFKTKVRKGYTGLFLYGSKVDAMRAMSSVVCFMNGGNETSSGLL